MFLLACGLGYLNLDGFPEFMKARLVSALRARGLNLNFTRLRLRSYHGLVADNVTMGRADDAGGPRLSMGEADIRLNPAALLKLRLQVDSLTLHDGRLMLPLIASNAPPEQFIIDDIVTELRLLPDDQWELGRFQALCMGARLDLSGTLANASAVRDWQFRRDTNQPPGLWQTQLREAVKVAKQLHFDQPPEIHLNVRGDARRPAAITADFRFSAREATTGWGNFEKLVVLAELNRPSGSNEVGQSTLKLQLDGVRTPWGTAKLSRLHLKWAQSLTNPMPTEAKLEWELTDVHSLWGEIPEAHFSGSTTPSPSSSGLMNTELILDSGVFQSEWFQFRTNHLRVQLTHLSDEFLPLQGEWQWQVDHPQSRWGEAQSCRFDGHLTRAPTNAPPRVAASRAWWAGLEPFYLDWQGEIAGMMLTNVLLDKVTANGSWRAPQLDIKKIHADLYGRQFEASTHIDLATRAAAAGCEANFDVHKIEPLLTMNTRRLLDDCTWADPPRISARAAAILPVWTNSQPDWRGEVLPALTLDGAVNLGNAAFRGVPVTSAQLHFSFSNLVWKLPDFVATRPEGRLEVAVTSDVRNHDYFIKLRSRIDPQALPPLFEDTQYKIFDFFKFNGPPSVEGEIGGRWGEPETTTFSARVNATNFVFRDVPVDEVNGEVRFTNRFLTATGVTIRHGEQTASLSGAGYDLATHTVFLTNGFSTLDPKLVMHVIGPKTETLLSPYAFLRPPVARVDGFIRVSDGKHSDLRVELSGGPFNYWKFNTPQISGRVRWADETVTITNLQADFYRGKLESDMYFDSTAPHGADFNLRARVTDIDLGKFMTDISSPTSRLEGFLGGNLTITRANSDDWESWNGFGNVRLRDGYLWDIPLFGIFSPALNAVAPGVGSSRVSGGTATFTITNSVIHTGDLDIRSPAMRLAYKGTIDFKGMVNARVEARLLRDAWLVGPVVSLVLSPLTKLFEYKVTGSLHQPEKEPLYIPKPLLFPLRPLQTLKDIFGEDKTNSPPAAERAPPR